MEKINIGQSLFPHLPERLAGLEELAENLWWSWNPGARMLFKTLDRQAWKESGHNPDKMLRELPRELLEEAAADTDGGDAGQIYRVLEDQIIPLYYKTAENGIPQDWVKAMKAAMISNAARFSARRLVKEYIAKFYSKSIQGTLEETNGSI